MSDSANFEKINQFEKPSELRLIYLVVFHTQVNLKTFAQVFNAYGAVDVLIKQFEGFLYSALFVLNPFSNARNSLLFPVEVVGDEGLLNFEVPQHVHELLVSYEAYTALVHQYVDLLEDRHGNL